MNTKGIKFLAVLAVMVMAFAAIVALAPADKDVDAVNIYEFKDAQKDPAKIGSDFTGDYDKFYFSADATVKVYDVPFSGITIYVQNGMELEIDVKGVAADFEGPITVYSVTGDLQRNVTSTVYNDGEDNEDNVGKIIINNTKVQFNGVPGQTVIYTSMMPILVDTHTTSDSSKKVVVKTDVYTYELFNQAYAYLSADGTLDATEIGKYVAVAPGQFIDVKTVSNNIKVVYGIMITDYTAAASNTAATTEYRYYAVGANADSFDMDDTADVVDIKDGSILVNNETASIKATAAQGVKLTNTGKDKIFVETASKDDGGMSGTIVATGAVEFKAGAYVSEYGTVTISSNTTATGPLEVDGKLNLRNDAKGIVGIELSGEKGVVSAFNEKLWSYDVTKPYLAFNNTNKVDEEYVTADFKGQYDVIAINKSADVHDSFSTAVIERNQTFVVVSDTVVTTNLDVKGVLIINEGVTLTITKINKIGAGVTAIGQYAQIINNGEILVKTTEVPQGKNAGLHVKGGLFTNNGRIIANSEAAANTTEPAVETVTLCVDFTGSDGGIGFINNGTITANKNDRVSFQDDRFINKGSFTVNGIFEGGEFTNGGSFTFNNAKILSNLNLHMAWGASLNIVAAEIAKGAEVTVDDILGDSFAVKAEPSSAVNVRGINVVDALIGLDLSGNIGVTKTTQAAGVPTIVLMNNIIVSDIATIGEGIAIDVSAANLIVPGVLTISKKTDGVTDATDNNKVTIELITGLIRDIDNRLGLSTTGFVGAQYIVPADATYYASVEDAITAAALADLSLVTVGYIPADPVEETDAVYPTITEDITVPGGLYVSGQEISIGNSITQPTVTIEQNAGFTFANVYLVEGTIVAANVNDIGEDTVAADVKIIDDEDYSAVFMSLGVALAIAQPGETIELSQNFENISRDLVIPEGVTVDATALDEHVGFFVIDSNLVINGLLVVDDFRFIATTDDTKKITVNGTIMSYNTDGKGITKSWYTPVGVSYPLTITDETGDEHTWYVLTNLSRLQESIDVADDAKVTVEGDVKLDDITIHGRDDVPAEVTFNGDVDAGTITIDDTTLIFKDGNKVSATVADALGSITIKGAYVKDKLSIYSMDQSGVYMAGQLRDDTTGTYSIRFDGITGMNGSTKTVIGWGNEPNGATPSILFAGETTAIGKKVTIGNSVEDDAVEGMVTITGDLIADNGNKLIINSDVEVLGGLYAAPRLGDDVPGTIEIAGDLFVGALMSDIYSAEDAARAYADDGDNYDLGVGYGHYMYVAPPQTTAAAIVSGKITVAEDRFITVLAGSVIDPAIVEDLESMDIVIEDTLWLTVYGLDTYSMDGLKAPIVNAKVDKILDANGNEVAKFSLRYKVIYGCPELDLGDSGVISVSLNYDAFQVTIKTDGSVKAVYIDGILMYTGENKNTFWLDKVATGTHKVTVEASTGYDADKCVLYTNMGTILPGMAFTFTEYDCVLDDEGFNTYEVIYNINGTEIQPEPVPPTPEEESQWTITTILLVILVVLIAIMAVIVALRLNRS